MYKFTISLKGKAKTYKAITKDWTSIYALKYVVLITYKAKLNKIKQNHKN